MKQYVSQLEFLFYEEESRKNQIFDNGIIICNAAMLFHYAFPSFLFTITSLYHAFIFIVLINPSFSYSSLVNIFTPNPKNTQGLRNNISPKLNLYDKKNEQLNEKWGINFPESEYETSESKKFPITFSSICTEAVSAINSVLYYEHDESKEDPKIASNVMRKSLFDNRATVKKSNHMMNGNAHRIGIEIDGIRYLLKSRLSHSNLSTSNSAHRDTEALALRRLSLLMASKLSLSSQNDKKQIPVYVYFQTLRQTLLATQELKFLMQEELSRNNKKNHKEEQSIFNNVSICCLGQKDDLPPEISNMSSRTVGKIRTKTKKNKKAEPPKALIMIIQPSSVYDVNGLYFPESPSSNNNNNEKKRKTQSYNPSPIESLQRLTTLAAIHEIPTIFISPRLSSTLNDYPRTSLAPTLSKMSSSSSSSSSSLHRATANLSGGINSFNSGNTNNCEMYGGNEPARPQPWFMRDFSPPW